MEVELLLVHGTVICYTNSVLSSSKYKEKTKDKESGCQKRFDQGWRKLKTCQSEKRKEVNVVKMKRNKSSEVIPLRPRIPDVKETVGTEQTCLLSCRDETTFVVWFLKSSSEARIPLCLSLQPWWQVKSHETPTNPMSWWLLRLFRPKPIKLCLIKRIHRLQKTSTNFVYLNLTFILCVPSSLSPHRGGEYVMWLKLH